MQVQNDITKIESGFARQVVLDSGVDLFACYQCEKCTNGCPVTFAMDYEPHRVIRMVQLGLRQEIARANTIWVCASCETCVTRCPHGIDIPKLMDYLKQSVLSQGDKPAEGAVAAFHQVFLENIRRFGRVSEAFLMGAYQLESAKAEKKIDVKEMISNLKLGIEMLKRGRLGFMPKKTGAKEAVKKLFANEKI